MTNHKLFLSYARADGSLYAVRLAEDLKRRGFDVWIDQEDIRAGKEWDAEIEKALKGCDCLLFLETEKSVISNHVLDEVYFALEQNKKVIPLIYVDSQTPFRLRRLQHIDFTKEYDTALTLLLKELESPVPASILPREDTTSFVPTNRPFYARISGVLLLIGCLVILITVTILLLNKNTAAGPMTSTQIILPEDTVDNDEEVLFNEGPPPIQQRKEQGSGTARQNIGSENNTQRQDEKPIIHQSDRRQRSANSIVDKAKDNLRNLTEIVAGEWSLVAVKPNVKSYRGYLKIEVVNENKVTVKSYVQFYYPESNDSSFLTIFNAFANCASCTVKEEMKLVAEDIAVGSRIIKKLKEDGPDGKKAGDVIMDANANKSVRGTITLQFVAQQHAILIVTQPQTIALAHEFMLQPFVYTFHFKKNE
ncbi:MAG: toll/interleukin-1 receptor domain-containing protein [Chitinophagaceae bacterium]|nr:MAG: toll/interleukin-1 receptor domain-containing protein [Chitinophagaceae bacterium]